MLLKEQLASCLTLRPTPAALQPSSSFRPLAANVLDDKMSCSSGRPRMCTGRRWHQVQWQGACSWHILVCHFPHTSGRWQCTQDRELSNTSARTNCNDFSASRYAADPCGQGKKSAGFTSTNAHESQRENVFICSLCKGRLPLLYATTISINTKSVT